MSRQNKNLKKIKNINMLNLLLLFLLLLISPISNDEVEWLPYKASLFQASYKHTIDKRIITVGIDFGTLPDVPNYFKFTVTPNKGFSSPILCFSPTDPLCINDRQILVRRTDGLDSIIHIKKGKITKLYVQIICLEDNCRYSLKAKGSDMVMLDVNSEYSYLVSETSKEMEFKVTGSASTGSYLTIGIEGSSSADLVIDGVEKQPFVIDNGKIVTFPIESKSLSSTFSIKGATIGDYITLSVHVVNNDKAPEKMLYPNGPVVMGLLDSTEGYFKEECFPVSAFTDNKYLNVNKFYLTGKIYSKYGLFWMADENNLKIDGTELKITDGLLSYIIEPNGLKRSICFGFLSESSIKTDYVAYSISILEPITLESFYNFYPPQEIGQIYRRMIPKGGYAVYNGATIGENDQRYSFNLYNRKGIAEMYVTNCTTFPECTYTEELFQNMAKPKRVNRMTIWEEPIDETYNALDPGRNVMIVYCKDDDNENSGYCEFDTSVNVVGKAISLVENAQYSKYVLKRDKGTFKLDFKKGIEMEGITIDIMIYCGDVSFNVLGFDNNNKLIDKDIEISYVKYYLSNKILYRFDFPHIYYDSIELEYIAERHSFFTIKYQINSHDSIDLEENILSGETYLVQLDPSNSEKYKTVYLSNNRIKKEQAFLVNFYALNCDFQVTRKNINDEINFYKGYGQELILPETTEYNSENYEYKIKITKVDSSNYINKMCMLYVSGYESPDQEYETEIVLAENLNHKVTFNNNFKSVRFLYPHPDPRRDLAINIQIINAAKFNVKFYMNSESIPFKEDNIFKSQYYFISYSEIQSFCGIGTLCNIIAQIECSNNFENNPSIEISIRPILNTPTYLRKNEFKKDFSYESIRLYLYTEIGKNDNIEITVNYLRDFGNIYGKIVKKNEITPDENAEWRGLYLMPSKKLSSFEFNGYTKKLNVYPKETQDCLEGCYLLIAIETASMCDFGVIPKFYPFSILTRVFPSNHIYEDIPLIVIEVDEYIIGNVDVSQDEKIYQFYKISLPNDAKKVEFDFQSEVAELYINIGEEKPTTKDCDFILTPPGRVSILSLDKNSILEKADNKNIILSNPNSIEDITLIIGVWTKRMLMIQKFFL